MSQFESAVAAPAARVAEFTRQRIENPARYRDGGAIGSNQSVFDTHLWNPCPKVPGIGKGRNAQRGERGGIDRRKKQLILPCDDRCPRPIQADRTSSQSQRTGAEAIEGIRKIAEKIGDKMTLGLGAGNGRAKNLQPQLRLAQGGSETAASLTARQRCSRG